MAPAVPRSLGAALGAGAQAEDEAPPATIPEQHTGAARAPALGQVPGSGRLPRRGHRPLRTRE